MIRPIRQPLSITALCVPLALAAPSMVSGQVEEIVVTARKRAESLESAPVAVTAVNADDLREAQVTDIADLQEFVPNLRIRRGRTGTDANVYIRGIGTQGDDVFLDQGVGIYVDGIYLPRTAGSVIDNVDIEQIEVLRGPQGTLFGKNTVGGAIKITTVKPQPELSSKLMIRGGNFDTYETRSMINIPWDRGWLADKLFTRFNFATRNTRGYTKNTFLNTRWNDEATLNFLGAVRLLPTDDVTIDLSGQWQRTHGSGRGGECLLQRRSQFDGIPGGPTDEYYDYCRDEDRKSPFRFESDVHGLNDQKSYGTWATLTWDLGSIGFADSVNLKLLGSWREQEQRLREDLDMSRFALWRWSSANREGDAQGSPGVATQSTVELLQTTEMWDDRLSLVSGAFFYWEKVETEFDYLVFPDSVLSAGAGGLSKSEIDTDNFSWAIYSQAVAEIADGISLTGGMRYTRERKEATRLLSDLTCDDGSFIPCTSGNPPDVFSSYSDAVTSDRWTPMATLAITLPDDYIEDTPLDHLTTYFTYAKGFKGAGVNAAGRSFDPTEQRTFDHETLDSYEVGIKSVAFERRARVNLAFYYGDYQDLQLPTVVPGQCPDGSPNCPIAEQAPLFIVDNAGEATIKGAELEITLQPIDGLDVRSAASYQISEFDRYAATNVVVNPNNPDELPFLEIERAGERFPFVPRFSASVGAQYAIDVATGDHDFFYGTITPRIDWSYRSSVKYWGRELTGNVQRGYNLINTRLAYRLWDDSLELALWSRNLTDETYFDEVYQIPALVIGNITRFYGAPRTYGGEINFFF